MSLSSRLSRLAPHFWVYHLATLSTCLVSPCRHAICADPSLLANPTRKSSPRPTRSLLPSLHFPFSPLPNSCAILDRAHLPVDVAPAFVATSTALPRPRLFAPADTCAIYAARAQLNPVMFEGMLANGFAAGGQLTTTTDVENFPGFPEGIRGPEMMDLFRAQSLRFGTTIHTETISRVDLSSRPFKLWREGMEQEEPETAETLVIATGASARRMHIPGEETYWQSGISACAVCDGAVPIFRRKPLAVVGGGDSACEEAMYLTKVRPARRDETGLSVSEVERGAPRALRTRLLTLPFASLSLGARSTPRTSTCSSVATSSAPRK